MSDLELDIHTFTGKDEGPTLTVLGAVHGNEHCGPDAINKLIALIESGDIKITDGTLTVIPVCNPRAYRQKVRFTERNLNRFMFPKDSPRYYEDHLDNIICPILEKTDYLLDLHSYTSEGDAFVFLGQLDKENLSFAKALGVPRFIYGWAEALSNADNLEDKKQAQGTTEYARLHGAVGLTLECGTHSHPRNADVGFEAICGALEHLGIARIPQALRITDLPTDNAYNIRMKGAQLKTKEGDFTQDFKNMQPVPKGTKIASYNDGEDIIMSESGYIVLPNNKSPIGAEWFFWGVEDPLEV
jgi:predicted deacylase